MSSRSRVRVVVRVEDETIATMESYNEPILLDTIGIDKSAAASSALDGVGYTAPKHMAEDTTAPATHFLDFIQLKLIVAGKKAIASKAASIKKERASIMDPGCGGVVG